MYDGSVLQLTQHGVVWQRMSEHVADWIVEYKYRYGLTDERWPSLDDRMLAEFIVNRLEYIEPGSALDCE